MGADALLRLLVSGEEGEIWVFDDFEFVLLVGVEETIKGCRGEVQGFSYKRGKCG